MSVTYGLIGLNSLFMFGGTWIYQCRVCSVYFTLFMCLFQLAIQITVPVILFTPYTNLCVRSVFETMSPMHWTMTDEIALASSLWIFSFFTMCCFACCGMCAAVKPKQTV